MASTMSSSATTNNKTSVANTKILADLGTLKEKMELCNALMNPGAGAPKPSLKSEAMLAVVGFLEACAPRMVELVEVAAQGALSEDVFAECLAVNDQLQKQLADIETAALTETSASTTAASVAPSTSVEQQFEDLLLEGDNGPMAPLETPIGKSTGEEDAPGAATGKSRGEEDEDAKQSAVTKKDSFDDFFAERTAG